MRLIAADDISASRRGAANRVVAAKKIDAESRVALRRTKVRAADTEAAYVVASNGVACRAGVDLNSVTGEIANNQPANDAVVGR